MGRRKRSAVYTQQATYAAKWEAHQPTKRAAGAAVHSRPRVTVGYRSLYVPTTTIFRVNTSQAGVNLFTAANLGLADEKDITTDPPRRFRPATIHVAKLLSKGVRVEARVTGRSYIKYVAGTIGSPSDTPNTFSAAISSALATPAGLIASFKACELKIKEGGGRARIWMLPEYFPEERLEGQAGV